MDKIPAKILSLTPGRLRLKIAPIDHQGKKIEKIANFLLTHPQITDVRINIPNQTIVVYHNNIAEVLAALQNIAIIVTDISAGNTEAAINVSSAVLDLNQQVQSATGGKVDLRFLFPLGLSILALRQLIVRGLQLEIIPWYVLAWYSFDSFIKLNGHRPTSRN